MSSPPHTARTRCGDSTGAKRVAELRRGRDEPAHDRGQQFLHRRREQDPLRDRLGFGHRHVDVQASNVSSSHGGTPIIKNDGAAGNCRNNVGFATEAQGTAIVASGSTSVTVSHGLAETPALRNIAVSPTNALGNATKFGSPTPRRRNSRQRECRPGLRNRHLRPDRGHSLMLR